MMNYYSKPSVLISIFIDDVGVVSPPPLTHTQTHTHRPLILDPPLNIFSPSTYVTNVQHFTFHDAISLVSTFYQALFILRIMIFCLNCS